MYCIFFSEFLYYLTCVLLRFLFVYFDFFDQGKIFLGNFSSTVKTNILLLFPLELEQWLMYQQMFLIRNVLYSFQGKKKFKLK